MEGNIFKLKKHHNNNININKETNQKDNNEINAQIKLNNLDLNKNEKLKESKKYDIEIRINWKL